MSIVFRNLDNSLHKGTEWTLEGFKVIDNHRVECAVRMCATDDIPAIFISRLDNIAFQDIHLEQYHSGRTGAGWYNGTAYFPSRQEARLWRTMYLASYHPAGYGTHVTEPSKTVPKEDKPELTWVVTFSRAGSCS